MVLRYIGNAPGPGATIGLQKSSLVSSIQENLFVAGKAFSYEDYIQFGADQERIITLDTSAYVGENLVFLPFIFYSTSGPITIDFYTDVVADNNGTILQASNRREGFPLPVSVLRLDPSNFSGFRFAGDLVPAVGLTPAVAKGEHNDSNVLGLPFELRSDKKHAIKITNHNGAGVLVQIKMTWFEV
jgi:hypothetical protein